MCRERLWQAIPANRTLEDRCSLLAITKEKTFMSKGQKQKKVDKKKPAKSLKEKKQAKRDKKDQKDKPGTIPA
jgi:hypothetical protein